MALEEACFPPEQAYDRTDYRHLLTQDRAVNLVHETDGRIVGFLGALCHRGHRTGHVFTVNVHPDARGQGIGRRLMDACETRLGALGMRRVILEVNVDNASAIRLYERCGYHRLGRIPDYYEGCADNDAFVYAKDLRR